jgi:hypothetical protein
LIVHCFSNTLCLEKSSASVPANVFAAAVSHDTLPENEVTDKHIIVLEIEAAANDIEMEEHLPDAQEGDGKRKQQSKRIQQN